MANKKLNDLDTTVDFDYAYVELDSNQYKITKENLGKQLTQQVHLEFNTITSNPDYIFVQDASNYRKISLHNLAKAIRNDISSLNGSLPGNKMIYDGCFIMYHKSIPTPNQQTDSWPRIATYAEWPALYLSGEEADGVLIVEGGHFLLVAPHEKKCHWSSEYGLASSPNEVQNYGRAARLTMLNTWNGQERTERICTSSSFSADSHGSSYAPGYCYNYTPHTEIDSSTGKPKPGLRPHQYWLPCVAELMLIHAHKDKINAGLALIYRADLLLSKEKEGIVNYWTSIEDGSNHAWYINLKNGYLRGLRNKKTDFAMARPVSTFAQSSLVGAA